MLATLIRLLGDFDRAEEALHDAVRAALEQWPRDGIPSNPRAWLVSTGRFKAIDGLRRQKRFDPLEAIGDPAEVPSTDPLAWADEESVEDDRLRLIFTCCHPALSPDAQIALTLREVCGLTTEEIARAFLTPASTLAQRIVRAKGKIRDAHIPYQVPQREELPERLDAVLRVVYLVFNEGYAASSGSSVVRHDLAAEAIRLGRLLVELLPEPEGMGLLALCCCTSPVARRGCRQTVTLCFSTNRIAACGIARRSPKACNSSNGRCDRDASGRMRCRPPSRRCMPKRQHQGTPIGPRWSDSTTC